MEADYFFSSLHMDARAHWEEIDVQQQGKGPSVWAWPVIGRSWGKACWKRTLVTWYRWVHASRMMDTINFYCPELDPGREGGWQIGVGDCGEERPHQGERLAGQGCLVSWFTCSDGCWALSALSFISISSRTISHFTGETFFMRIFILSTIWVNLGPQGTVEK